MRKIFKKRKIINTSESIYKSGDYKISQNNFLKAFDVRNIELMERYNKEMCNIELSVGIITQYDIIERVVSLKYKKN